MNNAGFGTRGNFAELPLDREVEQLDLNVKALVRLTHAALASMTQRKRGGIINLGSTGAFQPVPNMATYAATKAFVLSFSEAVHEEARRHGVSVTCLCPGPVRTEFQRVAGVESQDLPSLVWTSPDSVVRAALSALRAGRAVVVPGLMNKLGAFSVRIMPRFLVRRVAGSSFRRSPAS